MDLTDIRITSRAVYIDCSEFVHGLLSKKEWASCQGLHIHRGDPNPAALPALLAAATAVMNGHTVMDERLLRACPEMHSIVFLGTGASSYIDVDTAQRLGIRVRTIRGYGNRSVAEHAFALILTASRRVAEMDRARMALHRADLSRFAELDSLFHLRIASLADNRLLLHQLSGLHDKVRLVRLRPADFVLRAVDEHRRITEALQRRDTAVAVAEMRSHIRSVVRLFAAADRLTATPLTANPPD